MAQGAETTARAVYRVFGSKQGLVAALAAHAFDLLHAGLERLPVTPSPESHSVEAGLVIRQFAIEHPSLFRIALRNTADPFMRSSPLARSASRASLDVLKRLVAYGLYLHTPGGILCRSQQLRPQLRRGLPAHSSDKHAGGSVKRAV